MPASVPSLSQAYADQKKRNMIVGMAIGGIALVIAVAFAAMGGMRALGFGASSGNPKVLNAPGKQPNTSVLTAVGNSGPPVLDKQAQAPEKMPQDVYDWLKHLERCEKMKIEIAGDQLAEAAVFAQKLNALSAGIGLLDPYDQATNDDGDAPGSYTSGKIQDFRPRWEELITFFRSVTPPEECVPIANDFDSGLVETVGQMGDIAGILNMADNNPQEALQKAKKIQNTSYDINRLFARCDEKVEAICDKYNTHKWFNIKQDVSAGGMLGNISGL